MHEHTDIAVESPTVHKRSWCVSAVCSVALLAVLVPHAMAEPRGLIVQLGGSCPAPGEGRVIHYLLTDKGQALKNILMATAKWGNTYIEGTVDIIKKIEELTLYIIEQEKKNVEQERRIKELERKLSE